MKIEWAINATNLNLYSPLDDMEYRLIMIAKYPIKSIIISFMCYLFWGGMDLNFAECILDETKSLGLKTVVIEAGYFSTSLFGLIGRSTKFPEQLGQTFSKISNAHFLQYVHSNEQITASVEVFGKSLLQCSQFGLISSIGQKDIAIIFQKYYIVGLPE